MGHALDSASHRLEIPSVIWYTTLALLSWFTPVSRLQGGEAIGNYLLHLFFATMGAGTILNTLVEKGPVVFLFLVLVIAIHALIVFGVGKWFKLEVEMLAVASQAGSRKAIDGPCAGIVQRLGFINDSRRVNGDLRLRGGQLYRDHGGEPHENDYLRFLVFGQRDSILGQPVRRLSVSAQGTPRYVLNHPPVSGRIGFTT